ncbi:hypothetical protein [Saccharothrix sp. HUAS TT1]|uniref:hypothetical protein n=1 Tax=unclassified Saccharothrix TaxID=2593673 RepID=UPI00345BE3A8
MDIGEPERSGRHRLDDGAALWLPMGGELEHTPLPERRPLEPAQPLLARPLPARPLPPPDPLVDTDAMGLGKFNIGLVPASVTPPRTWKRAAWFAVLSSAGVLVGLAIAAAKLVGTVNPTERIGLPGYPVDVPLLTGFPTTPPPPTTTSTSKPPDRKAAAAAGHDPRAAAVDAAGTGDVPATARVGGDPGPGSSPHVTTVPVESQPVVDAEAIATSTELFYEEVAANSGVVLSLVTDAFRVSGEAVLEERFGDVSLIEVREISVDPTRGVTVSTLQVTRKDGSTSTEKRELVFTTTGVPLIDGERPANGA